MNILNRTDGTDGLTDDNTIDKIALESTKDKKRCIIPIEEYRKILGDKKSSD